MSARTVSWWSVHEFVVDRTVRVDFPMAGTPAWCALSDDDPAKLAAVLDAGQHHVLRMEIAQEARAQAAKDVAAAADWPAIAREVRQLHDARRSGARIERGTHV